MRSYIAGYAIGGCLSAVLMGWLKCGPIATALGILGGAVGMFLMSLL